MTCVGCIMSNTLVFTVSTTDTSPFNWMLKYQTTKQNIIMRNVLQCYYAMYTRLPTCTDMLVSGRALRKYL